MSRAPKFASIGLVEIGEELARARRDGPDASNSQGLVGRWFLSGPDTGGWQGQVLAAPSDGLYLVQLYSWMHCGPSNQRLVPLAAMADWTFYDDDEDMRFAYQHDGVQKRWEKAWDEKHEPEPWDPKPVEEPSA